MSNTSIIVSATPGSNRQDFSGELGMKFRVANTITVRALGRFKISGNGGNHLMTLYNASLHPIASALVYMGNDADADGFVYESVGPDLADGVVLSPGVDYYLMTLEVYAGESWGNNNYSITFTSDLASYSAIYSIGTDGTGDLSPNDAGSSSAFGPVAFKYGDTAVAPTPGPLFVRGDSANVTALGELEPGGVTSAKNSLYAFDFTGTKVSAKILGDWEVFIDDVSIGTITGTDASAFNVLVDSLDDIAHTFYMISENALIAGPTADCFAITGSAPSCRPTSLTKFQADSLLAIGSGPELYGTNTTALVSGDMRFDGSVFVETSRATWTHTSGGSLTFYSDATDIGIVLGPVLVGSAGDGTSLVLLIDDVIQEDLADGRSVSITSAHTLADGITWIKTGLSGTHKYEIKFVCNLSMTVGQVAFKGGGLVTGHSTDLGTRPGILGIGDSIVLAFQDNDRWSYIHQAAVLLGYASVVTGAYGAAIQDYASVGSLGNYLHGEGPIDYIFVEFGTNGITDDGLGDDTFYDDYSALVTDLRAAYPDAVIYCQNIFKAGTENASYTFRRATIAQIVTDLDDPDIHLADVVNVEDGVVGSDLVDAKHFSTSGTIKAGLWAAGVLGYTPPGDLVAPELSTGSTTTTTAGVGWSDADGGTAPYTYDLYLSTDNVTFTLGQANVGGGHYTITGLTPGTQYWFKLKVTDSAAASLFSNTVTQTTAAAPVAVVSVRQSANPKEIIVTFSGTVDVDDIQPMDFIIDYDTNPISNATASQVSATKIAFSSVDYDSDMTGRGYKITNTDPDYMLSTPQLNPAEEDIVGTVDAAPGSGGSAVNPSQFLALELL